MDRGENGRNRTKASGAPRASANGISPSPAKTSRPSPIVNGVNRITSIGQSRTAETVGSEIVRGSVSVIKGIRLNGWPEA
jgi:hypothetical protein